MANAWRKAVDIEKLIEGWIWKKKSVGKTQEIDDSFILKHGVAGIILMLHPSK